MEILFLCLFGLFAGSLTGVFGIGGGTIIVPSMMLVGYDIKEAVGISIIQMIFSSIFGTYLNLKAKNLNIKLAFFIAIGGGMGASLSGFILNKTPSIWLQILFIIVSIYSLIIAIKKTPSNFVAKKKSNEKIVLFSTGLVTGIFTISLGIGGGSIIVPTISYYLGLPTKQVVPMSLFFLIFASISGFSSIALQNEIYYKEGIIIGFFSLIGVFIGTRINKLLSNKTHKSAAITLYLIVLLVMIKHTFY